VPTLTYQVTIQNKAPDYITTKLKMKLYMSKNYIQDYQLDGGSIFLYPKQQ
jgi:hypothetical protein